MANTLLYIAKKRELRDTAPQRCCLTLSRDVGRLMETKKGGGGGVAQEHLLLWSCKEAGGGGGRGRFEFDFTKTF